MGRYVGIFRHLEAMSWKYIANVLNQRELCVNAVVKDYLTAEQLLKIFGWFYF